MADVRMYWFSKIRLSAASIPTCDLMLYFSRGASDHGPHCFYRYADAGGFPQYCFSVVPSSL